MRLPESCQLDPDSDLTLILLDREDTEKAIVDHLNQVVCLKSVLDLGRSSTPQTKNVAPTGRCHPVASEDTRNCHINDLREVRCKVSSKHLSLASPVFKALLCGGFAESVDLGAGRPAEVRLPDDNPSALWLLLYILHGQPKKVPTKLSLNMLACVTVLIDKYQLHDVAAVMTDLWYESLNTSRAPVNGYTMPQVLQWICIAWVLQKREKFSSMTEVAMRNSENHLSTGGVIDSPIPAGVLDGIEQARTQAIGICVAMLQFRISGYSGKASQCKYEQGADCDAMVLGGLIRGLSILNLYPLPVHPYDGISFSKLSNSLGHIRLLSLCDRLRQYRITNEDTCGVKKSLHQSIRQADEKLAGLKLDKF